MKLLLLLICNLLISGNGFGSGQKAVPLPTPFATNTPKSIPTPTPTPTINHDNFNAEVKTSLIDQLPFSSNNHTDNRIRLYSAGFGQSKMAEASYYNLPPGFNQYSSFTDGRMLRIEAEPGESLLILGPSIETKSPILIQCNVLAENAEGVSLTLGAIDSDKYDLLSTNASSRNQFQTFRKVSVLYDWGGSISPIVQIVNTGTQSVSVYIDNFTVYSMENLGILESTSSASPTLNPTPSSSPTAFEVSTFTPTKTPTFTPTATLLPSPTLTLKSSYFPLLPGYTWNYKSTISGWIDGSALLNVPLIFNVQGTGTGIATIQSGMTRKGTSKVDLTGTSNFVYQGRALTAYASSTSEDSIDESFSLSQSSLMYSASLGIRREQRKVTVSGIMDEYNFINSISSQYSPMFLFFKNIYSLDVGEQWNSSGSRIVKETSSVNGETGNYDRTEAYQVQGKVLNSVQEKIYNGQTYPGYFVMIQEKGPDIDGTTYWTLVKEFGAVKYERQIKVTGETAYSLNSINVLTSFTTNNPGIKMGIANESPSGSIEVVFRNEKGEPVNLPNEFQQSVQQSFSRAIQTLHRTF